MNYKKNWRRRTRALAPALFSLLIIVSLTSLVAAAGLVEYVLLMAIIAFQPNGGLDPLINTTALGPQHVIVQVYDLDLLDDTARQGLAFFDVFLDDYLPNNGFFALSRNTSRLPQLATQPNVRAIVAIKPEFFTLLLC